MTCSHLLSYRSLFNPGRSLSFPCDAEGHVALDSLSESARANYLYARALVGRDYAMPVVSERSAGRGAS